MRHTGIMENIYKRQETNINNGGHLLVFFERLFDLLKALTLKIVRPDGGKFAEMTLHLVALYLNDILFRQYHTLYQLSELRVEFLNIGRFCRIIYNILPFLKLLFVHLRQSFKCMNILTEYLSSSHCWWRWLL